MANQRISEIDLILASASPRRHELIKSLGLRFEVVVSDIDETPCADEAPRDYVKRLALEKARTAQRIAQAKDLARVPVLAADTIVCIDDQLLQKPLDRDDAKSMLRRLSARAHVVYSGIAVVTGEREASLVQQNNVRFTALSDEFIDWYIATGEPMDKAGSYAIQGKGGIMIEHIEGSFTGIMGLPLYETNTLLNEVGVKIQ